MTAVAGAIACLLALEWVFGPINLWRGRTMPNFVRFTGLPPRVATHLFAPFKLVLAVLLVGGLFIREMSLAGAVGTLAISIVYLVRLTARGRRHVDGLVAFGLTAAGGLAIVIIQLSR